MMLGHGQGRQCESLEPSLVGRLVGFVLHALISMFGEGVTGKTGFSLVLTSRVCKGLSLAFNQMEPGRMVAKRKSLSPFSLP
jgi:hypothetical protein